MLSGYLHIGMLALPLYTALHPKALTCPASVAKSQRESFTFC